MERIEYITKNSEFKNGKIPSGFKKHTQSVLRVSLSNDEMKIQKKQLSKLTKVQKTELCEVLKSVLSELEY